MTCARRASAIVAVLLLLAIGVVIAASVLVSADAAAAMSVAEMSRTQVRALAWSGLQGAMAELAEQRGGIVAGDSPQLTAEWSLFTLDDGTRAVVRLLDLTPDEPGLLAPENAKIDLNTAAPDVLGKAPGLSPELAAAIVAARASGPFSSVEQVLSVEGIDAEMLYGSPEAAMDGPVLPGGEAPAASGLREYLTAFSFDPNVQAGLAGDADAAGMMRVNINQPWSESLGLSLADRLGEAVAAEIGGLLRAGRTIATDGELVQALIDAGVGPSEWPGVLDVFTTSAEEFRSGRLDINRAPRAALACIPGITEQQAAQIVSARESLDQVSRQSIAWPVIEGILAPEDLVAAADHLTTRSTQWRIRIEAGLERGSREGLALPEPALAGDEAPAMLGMEPVGSALGHRMVYEAVIDIASSRPRIAYLREVTVLGPMLAMLSEQSVSEDDRSLGLPELPLAEPTAPADGREEPVRMDRDPPAAPAGGDGRANGADAPNRDEGERAPHREVGASDPGQIDPQKAEPGGGGDRRIGRWNTRRVSQP